MQTAMVVASKAAPPYGKRKGWIPRTVDDFGDGGAFPEIHVAQYPHNLGRGEGENKTTALAVQLDAQGKVKYDLIARQNARPHLCWTSHREWARPRPTPKTWTPEALKHKRLSFPEFVAALSHAACEVPSKSFRSSSGSTSGRPANLVTTSLPEPPPQRSTSG